MLRDVDAHADALRTLTGKDRREALTHRALRALVVTVAGVFVPDLDDLATVVRPARRADEMRPLRLMALRTLDGRHGAQFPVRRSAAPRLTAGRLPF